MTHKIYLFKIFRFNYYTKIRLRKFFFKNIDLYLFYYDRNCHGENTHIKNKVDFDIVKIDLVPRERGSFFFRDSDVKKRAYFAKIGDKIVHKCFVFSKSKFMESFSIHIDSIIGDCVTEEDYRGKHIFSHILQKIALNEKNVYALVSPNNNASIKSFKNANYKLVAHLKAKRIMMIYFFKKIILNKCENL